MIQSTIHRLLQRDAEDLSMTFDVQRFKGLGDHLEIGAAVGDSQGSIVGSDRQKIRNVDQRQHAGRVVHGNRLSVGKLKPVSVPGQAFVSESRKQAFRPDRRRLKIVELQPCFERPTLRHPHIQFTLTSRDASTELGIDALNTWILLEKL